MRVNLACELARKAPLVIHLDAEPVLGYETATEELLEEPQSAGTTPKKARSQPCRSGGHPNPRPP